jgi:alpha-L-rhamnosidase
MKKLKSNLLQATILSVSFLAFVIPTHAAAIVQNLKVEYSNTPIGIDVKNPQFCWQMVTQANERGYMQTAYHIIVKDQDGTITWDTQKVPGSTSTGIVYSGDPLMAATRYTWTVTVWDQKDKPAENSSWFETGLLVPDP